MGKAQLLRLFLRSLHSIFVAEMTSSLIEAQFLLQKFSFLPLFPHPLFRCLQEVTGMFWVNKSAYKEHHQLVIFSIQASVETLIMEALRSSKPALHHYSFFSQPCCIQRLLTFSAYFTESCSKHKWNGQQIVALSRGWRCSAFSGVTICTLKPTRSSICTLTRRTRCGGHDSVKRAMEVVERKKRPSDERNWRQKRLSLRTW